LVGDEVDFGYFVFLDESDLSFRPAGVEAFDAPKDDRCKRKYACEDVEHFRK